VARCRQSAKSPPPPNLPKRNRNPERRQCRVAVQCSERTQSAERNRESSAVRHGETQRVRGAVREI